MYTNKEISCCGIKELDDVESIEAVGPDFLDMISEELIDSGEYCGPAFLFFSTTQESNNDEELKAFIEKNELGEVLKSRARKNPGSGNMLTMYTWGINKKNLVLYWVKHRVKDED